MVPKLNEAEKRRSTFAGGVPVQMADGQFWHLPRPTVALRRAGPDATRVVVRVPGCDLQPLLDRVAACHEFNERLSGITDQDEQDREWRSRPDLHLSGAELNLAHALLLANYDLTDDEADELVEFSYDPEGDPEAFERRRACTDVAYGRSPKPSPDGSTPAS
jgi:hypothetical protein